MLLLNITLKFVIEKPFHLGDTSEEVLKIIQNIVTSKAAGIDAISGIFLKIGLRF